MISRLHYMYMYNVLCSIYKLGFPPIQLIFKWTPDPGGGGGGGGGARGGGGGGGGSGGWYSCDYYYWLHYHVTLRCAVDSGAVAGLPWLSRQALQPLRL